MNIVLSLVVIVGCSYIGYGVGRYFKTREKIWNDFVNFCEFCDVQIGFFQNKLQSIMDKFVETNSTQKETKKMFKKIGTDLQNAKNLKIESIFLNDDEKGQLNDFFNALGKSSADNQKNLIGHHKSIFSKYQKDCTESVKKNAPLATKLGFFLGLALAICLL